MSSSATSSTVAIMAAGNGSRSRTAATNTAAASAAALTPARPAAPSPAMTESPGNWKHPRLAEITRRQSRSTFGERNAWQIMYNVAAIVVLYVLRGALAPFAPLSILPPGYRNTASWLGLSLYFLPLINIAAAAWPLFRAPDTLADIALTPGQRMLLGLPPVPAPVSIPGPGGSRRPATPASAYSTPPRYSRTPSMAGSPASSLAGSPSSHVGARPAYGGGVGGGGGVENGKAGGNGNKGNASISPYSPSSSALAAAASGSPLFHRAAGAASGGKEGLVVTGSGSPFVLNNNNSNNNTSNNNDGGMNSKSNSPSGMSARRRGSYGGSASGLFGEGAAAGQGTSSPTSGKRSSVALNNKWLYERGRRMSGNGPAWLQHREL